MIPEACLRIKTLLEDSINSDKSLSFLVVPQVLNLVVVVIKQSAEIQLVVVFDLEFNRVALFRPLLSKDHLGVIRIILDCDCVSHEKAEGVDGVVFSRVY
jgi:hypothetical protein